MINLSSSNITDRKLKVVPEVLEVHAIALLLVRIVPLSPTATYLNPNVSLEIQGNFPREGNNRVLLARDPPRRRGTTLPDSASTGKIKNSV